MKGKFVLDGVAFDVENSWFSVSSDKNTLLLVIECPPTKEQMAISWFNDQRLTFDINGGSVIEKIEDGNVYIKFREDDDCGSAPRVHIYTHHHPSEFDGKITKNEDKLILDGSGLVDYGDEIDARFSLHCDIEQRPSVV